VSLDAEVWFIAPEISREADAAHAGAIEALLAPIMSSAARDA
jgi:hypothetical protein